MEAENETDSCSILLFQLFHAMSHWSLKMAACCTRFADRSLQAYWTGRYITSA